MKTRMLMACVGLMAAGNTFAFHCPTDMQKIDQALKANSVRISAEQVVEVKRLRAEGESLHNQGRHQESVEVLAKAMKILGVE